ncbi:hypothetical protein P154DRAFT_579211 [Amniculicola lignicola CBS 123094]|uniref:Uncharacterized protein n=1 Tax=Amniculicola lignicola CBS 123094 TaxID=1392246 RepID=A0A6A5WD83_9PLEO|nr:hypothetical protein P154DRAFT_579211 [Amniculicola lignicola CBS 123094]
MSFDCSMSDTSTPGANMSDAPMADTFVSNAAITDTSMADTTVTEATSTTTTSAQTGSRTAIEAWNQCVSIMHNGPSTPADDFIYELMKTTEQPLFARSPSFTTLTFSQLDLFFGFHILQSKVQVDYPNFWLDMYTLTKTLGYEDGDEVGRIELVDEFVEEARRRGMAWVQGRMEPGMVMFGVVETCVIQRRRRNAQMEELGRLMAKMELAEEKDVLEGLAEQLGEGLSIER